MRFEFATAKRIIFGPGTIEEVGPIAAGLGRTAFVALGRTADRAAPLLNQLNRHKIEFVTYSVDPEPTTTTALEGTTMARQAGCDFVIGFGGGSVLDIGKVVAALLTNPGEVTDYLEVIGGGRNLSRPSAPYIAIPTTSGSGAEVTRNAVVRSPEHQVKASMRGLSLLPLVAVVDPVLTFSMPPALTASTGLDAFTQLLEAYLSNQASPLTDALCLEGLRRAARSLRRCYENGSDRAAREDMSLASLLGGLALANAKLGAVHGLAAPLGAMFFAPHGAVCARLLPYVMVANITALQSRSPGSPALPRYREIARILTATNTAEAADGVAWVRDLCETLKVSALSQFGLQEKDFRTVVARAQNASSMKGNPIGLTDEELTEILRKAL